MLERVVAAISAYRYRCATEDELQRGLALALERAGLPFEREKRLTSADRVDFFVAGVGVEVKIKGGRAAATRQLLRYAQDEAITGLVLVTNRAQVAGQPAELNGKPVAVVNLLGGLQR